MTDREKLIELLMQKGFGVEGASIASDHLLANGVAIADKTAEVEKTQWIPVAERLPENDTTVLVYRPTMAIKIMPSYYYNRFCAGALNLYGDEVITHWMPLPEPPKEE